MGAVLPSLRHFLAWSTILPIAIIIAVGFGFAVYVKESLDAFDVTLPFNMIQTQREATRHLANVDDAVHELALVQQSPSNHRNSLGRESVKTAIATVATSKNEGYTVSPEVMRIREQIKADFTRIQQIFDDYDHAQYPASRAINDAVAIAQQTQVKVRELALRAADSSVALQRLRPEKLHEFRQAILSLLVVFSASAVVMLFLIISRTAARNQLRAAQVRLAEAIEGVSESFVLFDPVDRLVMCNSKYRELNAAISDFIKPGMAYDKILRASIERGILAHDDDEDADALFASRLRFHRKAQGTYEQRLENGNWLQISERRTRDGGIVSVQTEITDLKLREYEYQRKALIFENMSDAVVIADLKGNIVDWSPSAERATGYRQDEMLGKSLTALFLDVDAERMAHSIAVRLKRDARWEGELRFRCKTGHIATWELAVVPLSDERSKLIGTVAVGRDVSTRKEAEARIEHMATHDYLTSLPNRTLFRDRLAHALASARRRGEQVAILLFDLDNFKDVNDTLGHGVGDLLLMETAERLKKVLRDSDTIARLGGDEFAIVQTGLSDTLSPGSLATRIREATAAPYHIDNNEVHISTSIGIAVFPADGEDPDELLKNADMALYLAKNEGRNNHQFFAPEMNRERQARKELLTDLRHAIEENGFALHFQPQISVATGKMTGAEVLLRWPHGVRGLVPPSQFIPIAETSGLILALGDWVLRETCLQIRQWADQGLPALRYAVNLSALQFRHHDLVSSITETLAETGVSPTQLELEITESVVMHNVEGAIRKMNRLAELGIDLAIDDFGTGYSSLSYLKRFPVRKVKIDGSFVQDITQDPDDAAIVRAVINLGHSMNLEVVAEGVETEEQLNYLKQERCDTIQGYYYSRPVDANAFSVQLMKLLGGELALPASGRRPS